MKIDRLIGIITYLLKHDKTTATQLASRFEVSRRTIVRDIATLCQAGIPIMSSSGGNGGLSIMPGFKIDNNVFTANELQSVIVGLKGMDSISNNSEYKNLLMKLTPNNNHEFLFKDSIIIDLSSHYKESLSEKISLIRTAINQDNIITFDYYYEKGESRRRVEPYFIAFKWTAWYLFCWCTERNDFRLFKLNRLWNINITNESFVKRDVPDQMLEINGGLSDKNKIKVLFDKSVKYQLIDTYGLNCYTDTSDGLLLEIGYTNKDNILSWVLGFGDKAEVLGPIELRSEIEKNVVNLFNKYK